MSQDPSEIFVGADFSLKASPFPISPELRSDCSRPEAPLGTEPALRGHAPGGRRVPGGQRGERPGGSGAANPAPMAGGTERGGTRGLFSNIWLWRAVAGVLTAAVILISCIQFGDSVTYAEVNMNWRSDRPDSTPKITHSVTCLENSPWCYLVFALLFCAAILLLTVILLAVKCYSL
ncbi:uncharacterized protein LOC135300851 isoform X2 [Passer domesticus]|uniref:uncharacterized protein LOC135300851 isoform X2 n=1 Tax=Passer domesticus TaxID=48849 RepID=UPI0030FE90BE